MTIADLRAELGMSQAAFAAQIGLSSKGNVSVIERENRCGLAVALQIESLSGGRINAAQLCGEVAAARLGCVCHAVDTNGTADKVSPDKRAATIGRDAA